MAKHKKVLALALALVMALSLCTVTALADYSTNWGTLSRAIDGTQGSVANVIDVSDADGVRTIKLLTNITAGSDDAYLAVLTGKNVILDLNGHTLSRGLSSATTNGSVIIVVGTLTVKDSAGGGKITGGYSNAYGGAVYVSGGKFTLESGEISGNKAVGAGGIIVESGAEFVMTGGKITNNTVTAEGGGVFLQGSFTMTGGEVSGNEVGSIGGGVCCVSGASFTVGGNAKITGNTVTSVGTANNVYLCTGTTIGVSTDTALSGASIGVTVQTAPAATQATVITDTNAQNTDTAFFNSDNALYAVNFHTNYLELVENTESWAALQTKISEASAPITIKLNKSITAQSNDEELYIPEGKTVTLDLNGFTLDRGLKTNVAVNGGNVIRVVGALTIKDSSSAADGKVTGGNSADLSGGGIVLEKGTLTLESGLICDNKSAENGGGVLTLPGTSFIMNGGKITGNTTATGGGGVFCQGNFTLNKGEISGNSAKSGAGVYVYASDEKSHTVTKHFTMKDGKVINNIASDKGGGIYADNYDIGTQLLGGEISGNTAGALGGGVAANMPITVGGTVVVKNNTVKEAANNVYLRNVTKTSPIPVINISTTTVLVRGASIGVTLESGETGTFAENAVRGMASYFTNDATNRRATYDDGKLVFTEAPNIDLSGAIEDIFDLIRFKKTTDDIKTFSIFTLIFEFIKNIFEAIFGNK